MGFSPFNQGACAAPKQIDKLLGNTYDVVRHVAQYTDDIAKVSQYMHDVRAVANEVFRNRLVVGEAPAPGDDVLLPLPSNVTVAALRSFSVVLVTTAGTVYALGDPAFSARIVSGNLAVHIDSLAPAGVEGSEIRWTISYKGDLNEPQ